MTAPRAPERTLVLGGARSGKSEVAERLLADAPAVDYAATSATDPADADWQERVARHRRRRPSSWRTHETTALADLVTTPGPPLLIDSLTAWLTQLMDRCGAWTDIAGWRGALDDETAALVAAFARPARDIVVVSDEIGSGVVPATRAGRLFRDELGALNTRIAAACEHVLLVTVGIPTRLR